MENHSTKPQAHLFICCRDRDDEKACCYKKGAESLVEELKTWIKTEGLKEKIKVSKSSCLGQCEKGITACLYPKNQWFTDVNPEDLPEFKKMLSEYAL